MLRDFTWRVVWVATQLAHWLDDLLCIAKYRQFHAQIYLSVLCRNLYKQQR